MSSYYSDSPSIQSHIHEVSDSSGNAISLGVSLCPYVRMGNLGDSERAVQQVRIITSVGQQEIGVLYAQIFDMQKLADMGAMQVFDRIIGASPWIHPWGLADGNCS